MVSSDRLEPGAVGRIQATVDTANRSGSLVKHISVYSNDRVIPVVTLTVSMDVIKKP